MQGTGAREPWRLTQEAFDRLLEMLAGDRQVAAERYEAIRARLIRFFTWERAPLPEDHADETINRVAKRLSDGEEIKDAGGYFYGVARMVLREVMAETQRRARGAEEFERHERRMAEAEHDRDQKQEAMDCLSRCLEHAGPRERSFIVRYYQGDKRNRIENRRRMAEELDLPLNALRNRALRLREKIENCVLKCINAKRA
ncbi:MAG: sigma-70 family RNA polymerase sigma factor [Acidobacteria bacterium]|nr:sigma-70 family RNA polymerase sigma factor [Acidobacteriota bacterium]